MPYYLQLRRPSFSSSSPHKPKEDYYHHRQRNIGKQYCRQYYHHPVGYHHILTYQSLDKLVKAACQSVYY
jgi:hypothetical protein